MLNKFGLGLARLTIAVLFDVGCVLWPLNRWGPSARCNLVLIHGEGLWVQLQDSESVQRTMSPHEGMLPFPADCCHWLSHGYPKHIFRSLSLPSSTHPHTLLQFRQQSFHSLLSASGTRGNASKEAHKHMCIVPLHSPPPGSDGPSHCPTFDDLAGPDPCTLVRKEYSTCGP